MKRWLSLENLIYATVIFLPAYLWRLTILGMPTNGLEILIGVVFIGWLAEKKSCAVETHCNASLRWVNKKYIFFICLIFLGLIISTLANDNYASGLGIIKGWFVFPLLFVFVIYGYLPRKKMINVFQALYFSSFGVGLIALGYLFSGHLTYDGRLEAFFDSPNYLAMYLAPGIIIGTVMLALTWNMEHGTWSARINDKFFYISLVIILIALYCTYSYAAWVALAVALLAVFLLNNNFKKKYWAIPCLMFLILIFLLKDTVKFHDLASFNQRSSLASRIMIWQSAGKMLAGHWLLGIGPGNFQAEYLENQKYFPPYLEWAVPHPHNLYLAFWLYGGILGLAGFLGVVIFWFRDVLKKENDVAGYIALGIMIYILAHGLVDTTYFKNDLAVIFWLNFIIPK